MGNETQKKLDPRFTAVINRGVQKKQRSIFVIIGEHGKDHVVTLHYLLSKARVSARPSVLWCYKKELGHSSNTAKRMKQLKKRQKRNPKKNLDEDPLELFLTTTNIRYTYYKEIQNIMGNTYGMCVLQDFEALTPNILAQTIETVEGGGLIVFLIKKIKSLKQLFTINMDVHTRYRSEFSSDIVSRFNERFLLSLTSNPDCLVIDDELNILPISANISAQLERQGINQAREDEIREFEELKSSLKTFRPAFELVSLTKTLDQAKIVLNLLNILQEKDNAKTATLFAARGRGKTASLGISVAGAIVYGYKAIFVTSPSPENIKTLFEMLLIGLKELGYEEHIDYDLYRSPEPGHRKAITIVNVYKDGKQMIRWVPPDNNIVIAQADLLIIDEAAAIPLPLQTLLFGDYTTFISSTINGYEGTGRALTVKLMRKLRENYKTKPNSIDDKDVNKDGPKISSRSLIELTLNEPIRYSLNDGVEKWLNKLLCLDLCNPNTDSSNTTKVVAGYPPPNKCSLYHVDRDTLFSYHPASEIFFRKIMSLFITSHYKNSPNDIQLLSDAPAHIIFVLIEEKKDSKIPEPICAVQVCFEGKISKKTYTQALLNGVHTPGDTIPWIVTQHFQDENFYQLSGVRIVRIATHHEYQRMGYGKRAIELLQEFFSNRLNIHSDTPKVKLFSLRNDEQRSMVESYAPDALHTEIIEKKNINTLNPLLRPLSDLEAPNDLSWIGVAFGLNNDLHSFWKSLLFTVIYIRHVPNEATGDHTCTMIKRICTDDYFLTEQNNTQSWTEAFGWDFRRRLVELSSVCFKNFSIGLLLDIFDTLKLREVSTNHATAPLLTSPQAIYSIISIYDLKRLKMFLNNQIDYHGIIDLIQPLSRALFLGQIVSKDRSEGDTNNIKYSIIDMSLVQLCIFIALGLQKRSFKDIQNEFGLPASQIMALLKKAINKCVELFEFYINENIREEIINSATTFADKAAENGLIKKLPLAQDIPECITQDDSSIAEIPESYREIQKSLISSVNTDKYAINTESFNVPESFIPGVNALGVISVERKLTVSNKSPNMDILPSVSSNLDKKRNQNKSKKRHARISS